MARFLINGRSFSALEDYLISHNQEFVVLLDQRLKSQIHRLQNKHLNFLLADYTNYNKLVDQVVALAHDRPIDGILTTYENYIVGASYLAKALGLAGLPLASALACTDKELMRQKFSEANESISPDFQVIKDQADLLRFASQHNYPLIIKPANLSKSLLVTKANNQIELLNNYQVTLANIQSVYDKYAPNRQPKLLVEEFMLGSIHSVDAFIDNQGHVDVLESVVDYETGQDIGYDDNFHYSRRIPSSLSPQDRQSLRRVAGLGCQALGMRNSAAHVELIMTSTGPKVVEIGARNGGYRARMHLLANGLDIYAADLAIAQGLKANLEIIKNEDCVVLELFPRNQGKFQSISQLEQLQHLPSLNYLSLKVKPDTIVGKAVNGYKAVAVIILYSADHQQFSRDYQFVRDQVQVLTA